MISSTRSAPRLFPRGEGAAVFSRRLRDMALPAKGLATVRVVGVLSGVPFERDRVIALEPPGTAAPDTAPAVAVEYGAAYRRPAARVKIGVVAAHPKGVVSSSRIA